ARGRSALKDDSVYLQHILECIQRIEEDTAAGVDAFRASRTHQDAVLRNLQVLAESSQRLSSDLKSAWPQVEWKRIAAFRNVLVHDYLGLDLERIWQITQRDIAELKKSIELILSVSRGKQGL
ncbi:MAG TPA: DUF86 domain-containing protein, partial [Bryobacteraceae bacterium]|nr:DUF86 domain-containing protein [Bryobacteraceae bacterium]